MDAVGIFWLTRLLRDDDTSLRCAAARLLATLAHPSAKAMRDTLLQAWPEGGSVMLHLGTSVKQPRAVAAAALTFAAVAIASSTAELPGPDEEGSDSVRCRQLAAHRLRLPEFWHRVLCAACPTRHWPGFPGSAESSERRRATVGKRTARRHARVGGQRCQGYSLAGGAKGRSSCQGRAGGASAQLAHLSRRRRPCRVAALSISGGRRS